MIAKVNISTRWKNLQPTKKFLFWACVASAIATAGVGFKWGGWVTGNTARAMAATGAEEARVQLAVASCLVRFNQAADTGGRLARLQKTDSWMRGGYMEKAGWVTLVGLKDPVSNAGEKCAEQLLNPKTAAVKVTK